MNLSNSVRNGQIKGHKQDKMTVYDMPAQEYNDLLAEAIKKMPEFKMPEWALYIKTGLSRIKPPEKSDWWYNRAASILRQIYINKVVGVGRLRTRYGSRYNRGMQPEIFAKSSGKLIRVMLQQSEAAGLLMQGEIKGRKGRQLTEKGKEFLDSISNGGKK
mgnify:CR=1 FL=1|jgi:small subunit ribosomal protein S19e